MRKSLLAISIAFAFFMRVATAKLSDMSVAEQLVGTWSLESAEDLVDGKWVHRYGEHPRGYFTFGADGRVSVQFMKFPVTDDNKTAPLENYLAYFGTYVVDEVAGTFTTTVEGSLHPEQVGSKRPRPFRIEGNRLYVGGGSLPFRRTFSKVGK